MVVTISSARMVSSKIAQKGQILLIVILIMVVTLTVGLSIVTRTITNLRTTREERTSQQAFSAAEAGIEKIISTNATTLQGALSNDASFSTNVTNVSGTTFLVNNGNVVPKDDGADVWLSTYPTYATPFTGSVTVYWSTPTDTCNANPATNTKAALEIVILSGTTPSNAVARTIPLDPCAARATNNNFITTIQSGGQVGSKSFGHNYTITGVTSGLLMRIVPLYASSIVAVSGSGGGLPLQGQVIESTGTSGETQRKITVYKGYPKLPVEFFPFLLFSPN